MSTHTLLELCDKATPGPWQHGNDAVWSDCNGEGNSPTEVCNYTTEADAQLIARMSPDVCRLIYAALVEIAKERNQYRSVGITVPTHAYLLASEALALLDGKDTPQDGK